MLGGWTVLHPSAGKNRAPRAESTEGSFVLARLRVREWRDHEAEGLLLAGEPVVADVVTVAEAQVVQAVLAEIELPAL